MIMIVPSVGMVLFAIVFFIVDACSPNETNEKKLGISFMILMGVLMVGASILDSFTKH